MFAAGAVTSHPDYDPEDKPWTWKVDVDVYRTFIHEGVALDGL